MKEKLILHLDLTRDLDILSLFIKVIDLEFIEVLKDQPFIYQPVEGLGFDIVIRLGVIPTISGSHCYLPIQSEGRKPVGGLNKATYETSYTATLYAQYFMESLRALAELNNWKFEANTSGKMLIRYTGKIYTQSEE